MKVPNVQTRIYLDEFSLSGELNSTEQNLEQELAKTEAFSNDGPRRIVGNYNVRHSELGLFEPTEDASDEQIFALLGDGADHYLTKLFGANAEGNVAFDSVVRITGQPRSAQGGGAVLLNFDSEGSEGLVRGVVLGNVTSSGAENRTGRNQGATSAPTVYAVTFRVIAFTGTDITLALEESSDDGGGDAYAAISGLSNTFTAAGVARKTTAAATEAYKRLAITGTFSSAELLVTAGVVLGT